MAIHHLHNYVEYLKGKPEPIRRRYALAVSFGVTSLIAFAWLTMLATSGSLALTPAKDDASLTQVSQELGQLAGAAAAFRSGLQSGSLTVVATQASSTLDRPEDKTQDATVIPF